MTTKKPEVKTECVRRCQIKSSRCLGCKRTIDEIIAAGNKRLDKIGD